jgi:hypothetical protein
MDQLPERMQSRAGKEYTLASQSDQASTEKPKDPYFACFGGNWNPCFIELLFY